MNLVATYPVVVYAETQSSDNTTQSRLQEIIKKKLKIQERLNSVSFRIENMNQAIRENGKDLVATIEDLNAQIQKLQKEEYQSTQSELGKDTEFSEEDAEFSEPFDADGSCDDQRQSEETNRPEQKKRPTIQKEITALFRKIAAKTHPDKTKDPEMHQLFLQAKVCKDRNDYAGLKDIWECICGRRSSLLDKLLKRLHTELLELQNLERRLDSLYTSHDYMILQAFETDRKQVLQFTRVQMHARIKELSIFLNAMKMQARRSEKLDLSFYEFQF